jgi:hypothetical protein
MKRRYYYLLSLAIFVPLIIWYAGQFATVPELRFSEAQALADTTGDSKKVIVRGIVLEDQGIEENGSAISFFLRDDQNGVERVDYDGSEVVDPGKLREAVEEGRIIRVAGHMCGERFHAKNLFVD